MGTILWEEYAHYVTVFVLLVRQLPPLVSHAQVLLIFTIILVSMSALLPTP